MQLKFRWILILLLISTSSRSQDSLLSLDQAIEIALKNNYDITVARDLVEVADNENSAGNAGMLPDIDVHGTYQRSSNSLKQKYNTGAEVDRDASISKNISADVTATWTVFDGLRMFKTKDRLSEIAYQADVQLRIQIESSLVEIITAYYSIVRYAQLIRAIEEEILLSEEQLKISDRKMQNGSGSKLEWLQAKTNYNRQLSLQVQLKSESEASHIRLNVLLGREPGQAYSVDDTVIISYRPAFDDLKKTVIDKNNILDYYRKNQRIAELNLAESRAGRWPVISLHAQYIYSRTTNEAGFSLLNQARGFNYGATATLPLFRGFNINRQVKSSSLNYRIATIAYSQQEARINEALFNAWRDFENSLELLQIEEDNIGFAREQLSIAQERYRIGASSIVEQRESQRTFEDAMKRLADARFNAKLAETNLRKLNGELVR